MSSTDNNAVNVNIKAGETLQLDDFKISDQGIKYKIVKESDQEKPHQGDLVTVHYTGHLLEGIDKVGTKFDSSVDRGEPFQFNLGYKQVIEGWEHSLADMKIGEERIVILPSEQAYGDRAISVIPANSSLIFDIKLLAAN